MAPYGTNWVVRWYSKGKAKSEAEGAAAKAGVKRASVAVPNAAETVRDETATAAHDAEQGVSHAADSTEHAAAGAANTTTEAVHNTVNGAADTAKCSRPKIHPHESVDKIKNAFKFNKHQHSKEI